ncbi:Sugar lactone lactonase YvrE [Rhizobium sp. NFR07]|uniref:SMP-30/gluconolactonase/LRE family protein n=1 Tax=Rhizobium sp. NFR07 TaxID=1566262 RepID=UPI0008ED19B8|nr:SMP-30/gluconolactonase/LRE family protein [Rhizobium sp. NFR07]SFB07804.1 Sugar lactone lactonase YvrE [Rhizobium sp. NFR07]
MTTVHRFEGTILSHAPCELGEGPSFEMETNTLWWFDILGKALHELKMDGMTETVYPLPFMGSVIARIDDARQLIASDKGLFIRNRATGELSLHCELEPGKPENRSNDGRVHVSGSLWIGTMGKTAPDGAGAIYHVAKGKVTKLFDRISISNSICFSPDGATAYFVDTRANKLMKVAVDPATGLPIGEPSIFVDGSKDPGGIDGSVCDGEGHIWNARWGEAALDHYDTDGKLIERYALPAKRTTCPAFIGGGRIAVTSSWEGLDEAGRAEDPKAGNLFAVTTGAQEKYEFSYRL